MTTSHDARRAARAAPGLEALLVAVEDRLTALGLALQRQDPDAVERVAAELHTALATAMDQFIGAARAGGVPAPLRQRLALAGGQVAARREALARATAALDRAIDVLMPRLTAPSLYSSAGNPQRNASQGGSLLA